MSTYDFEPDPDDYGPEPAHIANGRAYRKMNAVAKSPGRCNPHPDAPHGFDRNASHSAGRYVCDCEGWVQDWGTPQGAKA